MQTADILDVRNASVGDALSADSFAPWETGANGTYKPVLMPRFILVVLSKWVFTKISIDHRAANMKGHRAISTADVFEFGRERFTKVKVCD
jgi:hypothetical protein